MNARPTCTQLRRLALAGGACLALLVGRSPAMAAPLPVDALDMDANETCEGCHARNPEARMTFADGSSLSVYVAPDVLAHSVHQGRFDCVDCHRDTMTWPHEPAPFPSADAWRRAQQDTCRRCHSEHDAAMRDSIHERESAAGNPAAPTCTECHGAHDIASPGASRRAVANLCSRCHEKEAQVFNRSVHAQGLAKGNPDVPVCTDCHGAHAIADTEAPGWHAGSYTICARCHGDGEMMKKYDLSENILKTYLEDFHGSSNHLYLQVGYVPERPVATCGDCHGYHDVASLKTAGSEEALRAKVDAMCRQCHENAPDGFAGAWLAHDEPTIGSAPLVWGVTWGYRILIPVMILGLVLHILLHLWRVPVKGV